MDGEELGAWIVFSLIILAICGGLYIWLSHVHTDVYIETTVIGHANLDVGKNYGGGSRTVCIMEDENDKRYTSRYFCSFLIGDEVIIHIHDKWEQKSVKLKVKENGKK